MGKSGSDGLSRWIDMMKIEARGGTWSMKALGSGDPEAEASRGDAYHIKGIPAKMGGAGIERKR